MEIITNGPSVTELQAQLEEERTNSGRLLTRLHEVEAELAATRLRLFRREGVLQALVRTGDRFLEEERRENAKLRTQCEDLLRERAAALDKTTCPACHRARPNEQDWRDGVCTECFSAGLTVPS